MLTLRLTLRPESSAEVAKPLPVQIESPVLTPLQLAETVVGPLLQPLAMAGLVIVLVVFNAAGKAQRLVVNHRPRSSVLVLSRAMLERFAGTPLAKHWEGTP